MKRMCFIKSEFVKLENSSLSITGDIERASPIQGAGSFKNPILINRTTT